MSVAYDSAQVLYDVSFTVAPGEIFGLVGESGCGKSTLAYALARHFAPGGRVLGGGVRLDGTDVRGLSGRRLREWRASRLAFVHQDAAGSLDPTMRIGRQLTEVLRDRGLSRREGAERAVELLRAVRLPDPERLVHRYPHQLSGGQQQRVVIAAALAVQPRLVILDEPTTGLDASVEHEVLGLLKELRGRLNAAVVFVSHDLGLIGRMCDRVGVLYAGRLVETGRVGEVLAAPAHPYTAGLLAAVPVLGVTRHEHPLPADLVEVRGLVRQFGQTVAVDHVDLIIREGEVLGLVGESGSGKTTLARAIAGIAADGEGTLRLRGEPLPARVARRDARLRPRIQMVFQNPDASLNPSHSVRTVLRRSLATLGDPSDASLDALLDRTRIDAELLDRRPAQLSGGQKQRVSIARSFAGRPDLVICDEPVSALDVSVQAAVLEVLADQRDRTGTSYLFISHDLAVVGYLADRIAVIYRGVIVEEGPAADVLGGPSHPYTALLVEAAPRLVATSPPEAPDHPPVRPSGCRFADRCTRRIAGLCEDVPPPERDLGAGHVVRCHLDPSDLPAGIPATAALSVADPL
ncbi:ABC transporter ATP-binding protein [Streptomyces avermitilis]|uniref:ABC transporter ATP-binding protein n=1 Tax=Streptomyces avermitilis TaxID=33903 RepID=A0A4D4M9N3_STRAX|nr:ABC transporter ATP-binding protein [Streptomyces avermitilis]GDY68553.1 ABC transporter ATP-binding protein [Streptomyces avermitilis]